MLKIMICGMGNKTKLFQSRVRVRTSHLEFEGTPCESLMRQNVPESRKRTQAAQVVPPIKKIKEALYPTQI